MGCFLISGVATTDCPALTTTLQCIFSIENLLTALTDSIQPVLKGDIRVVVLRCTGEKFGDWRTFDLYVFVATFRTVATVLNDLRHY